MSALLPDVSLQSTELIQNCVKRPAPTDHGYVWAVVDWSFLKPNHVEEDRAQFRSLVERVRTAFAVERTIFVVLERDIPWWSSELEGFLAENIIQQPIDRGSAPAVLAAALTIRRRDPKASLRVVNHLEGSVSLQQLLDCFRARAPVLYTASRSWADSRGVGPVDLDGLYPYLDRLEFGAVVRTMPNP